MARQKNQQLTVDLKERLFEYAHDHRTSMSAVVASVVDRIARGELTPPSPNIRPETVDIKYSAPENYDIAIERARAANVPLNGWVQLELSRLLNREEGE